MGQISTRTQTGTGSSAPMVLNTMITPFNVGIGCVVTGTVNYTIQHTFDDPQNIVTWFNHDDPVFVAATANANSNYAYPVTASKILVNSGTGSVTATYVQAGIIN